MASQQSETITKLTEKYIYKGWRFRAAEKQLNEIQKENPMIWRKSKLTNNLQNT